jgi:drug/metabolite transporter (DMT)-like permease
VVVAGVAMSAMTEFDFNMLGFLAATTSAFAMSVANTVQKSFMRKAKPSVNIPLISPEEPGQPHASSFDQNELFFLTNFFSVCMMLPFWWHIDGWRMMSNLDWETLYVSIMVFGNTVPNVTQHFSSLAILNLLSPVSHSLANSCKRVIVIALSVIYFRNPVSLLNFMGMACALGGVFFYQQSLSGERQKRQAFERSKSQQLEMANLEEQERLIDKLDSDV